MTLRVSPLRDNVITHDGMDFPIFIDIRRSVRKTCILDLCSKARFGATGGRLSIFRTTESKEKSLLADEPRLLIFEGSRLIGRLAPTHADMPVHDLMRRARHVALVQLVNSTNRLVYDFLPIQDYSQDRAAA